MAKKKTIKVVENPTDIRDEESQFEVMTTAIESIAESMRLIEKTRMSRKMLVVLIHDHTGIYKTTINNVLDSMAGLEKTYLIKAER